MLLALSATFVQGEEEEHKLDLPWAKQMTYNNDPIKAAHALRWLGDQKTNDAEAIKLIVEHLGDERQSAPDHPIGVPVGPPPVGDVAAAALKQIGAPAVPALIKLFESNAKPEAKIRGLTAIEQFGKAGSAAFPAIAKLATGAENLAMIKGLDEHEAEAPRQQTIYLRYHAYTALAAVATEPEKLLAALEPGLHEKDAYLQLSAIKGFATVGTAAKKFVPELTKLLDSEKYCNFSYADFSVGEPLAMHAAETLASMGAEAKAALPALVKKIADENEQVRTAAAYAHAAISGERSPGIEVLFKELNNPKEGREDALYDAPKYFLKLAAQGKFQDVTLPTFQKMLGHKSWTARNDAIKGIVLLKPKNAVEMLRPLAEKAESYENMFVKPVAIDAIRALTEASSSKNQK